MSRCTLIVTGAPLARRTADIVAKLQVAGFDVDLVATPASLEWVDTDAITAETGAPTRTSQRVAGSPRLPLPDLAIVCPATFNTITKTALGIADTHAHSFLCECLGARVPIVFVPMINERLWDHPALAPHLSVLSEAGATFLNIHDGTLGTSATRSGSGEELVTNFDPAWIFDGATNVPPSEA